MQLADLQRHLTIASQPSCYASVWLADSVMSACPFGVHAVPHAIAESGRGSDGAQWMRRQRAHCAVPSRLLSHNAWHLAMFDVDRGRVAPAIKTLDQCLLPTATTSPVDASDATTLLWRLACDRLDVSSRWRQLSDTFLHLGRPGCWPYVDLHAALAHRLAGHDQRITDLMRGVENYARGNNFIARCACSITLPLLRALEFTRTAPADTPMLTRDMTHLLRAAGASHA